MVASHWGNMAPMFPASWCSHPCVVFSHIVLGLVYVISSIRQKWWCSIIKKAVTSVLGAHFLSWITLSGGSMLQYCGQSYGEAHVLGNWSLWPTAIKELRFANSHVNELGSRFSCPNWTFRWLQPNQLLECNILETLTQNHPSKLLLNFWPSDSILDSKYLLF